MRPEQRGTPALLLLTCAPQGKKIVVRRYNQRLNLTSGSVVQSNAIAQTISLRWPPALST